MQKGFTLIEMSIVLVIVGLIIGGILAGEDILENSKRISIVSQLQKYKSAYESFKEKYYSPPGDMSDAESAWGASKTNNGDGDGLITSSGSEDYLAWQHLALAGFINGYYSGALTAITNVNIGVDIPEAPYTKTGYRMIRDEAKILFKTNSVQFGRYRSGSDMDNGALTPKQALNIDEKIDDRNPSEGQLITISGYDIHHTRCVIAGDAGDEDDTYAVSIKTRDCILIYYLDQTQQ